MPAAVAVVTVVAACSSTEAAVPSSAVARREAVTIDVSGGQRAYELFVPASVHAPAALVLDLHGLTGTPAGQDLLSGMQAKAEAEGFVVAQPAGVAGAWDALADRDQDLAFLRAVVADVADRVTIDPARIFATGMSNGGGMAHRLACDAADVFAAVAPVAGAYLLDVDCAPSRPVPVLAFHGTEDRVVPFTGLGTALPDVGEWAAAWAERNGCSLRPTSTTVAGDVRSLRWDGCLEGGDVELLVVEGGGHGWPGTDDPRRRSATTGSVEATDLIWEFFASHPLP
jgi:polyhydroxybutyrate depolymerase